VSAAAVSAAGAAAKRSVTGTRAGMMSRWRGASQPVRVAAAVVVIVLAYGTAVHLVHLVSSGFDPYPEAPPWLRTYFVALTVVDLLAAVLLARRTRGGVVLAVAVLVSDAAANGWANYVLDPASGVTVGRVRQAGITVARQGNLHRWRSLTTRKHGVADLA